MRSPQRGARGGWAVTVIPERSLPWLRLWAFALDFSLRLRTPDSGLRTPDSGLRTIFNTATGENQAKRNRTEERATGEGMDHLPHRDKPGGVWTARRRAFWLGSCSPPGEARWGPECARVSVFSSPPPGLSRWGGDHSQKAVACASFAPPIWGRGRGWGSSSLYSTPPSPPSQG